MKHRRSPKTRKYRGKRTLIVTLAVFLVPAVLTSLVFALQHDFSNNYPQTVDLGTFQLPTAAGNGQNHRGTIYDKNLNETAVSYLITSVYVHPRSLQDPATAAEKLAAILPLDVNELTSRFKLETGFVLLAKDIDSATADQITALKIEGVSLKRVSKRQYPYEESGAHIMGFANSTQGLDGIEFYYDVLLRDGAPEQLPVSLMEHKTPEGFGSDGVNLILTLDMKVQKLLQNRLDSMIKKTGAAAGVAAIMIPESGAVVAIANLPTFNPNHFWEADDQTLRNRFITDPVSSGGLDSFLKQAMSFHKIRNMVREKMNDAHTAIHKSDTLLLSPTNTKKRIYDFDNVVNIAVLNSLIKKAARQTPPPIDLPTLHHANHSDRSVTALQLLTEFCSITTGGGEIAPHLLHSVFDEATGRAYPAKYISSGATLNREVYKILEYIGQKGPENILTFESLISAVNHESLLDALPAIGDAVNSKYPVNYVMLSFIPAEQGSLALIVALDNADIFQLVATSGASSISRAFLDKSFFHKTKKWGLAPVQESSLAMLDRLEQLRPTKKKIKIGKTRTAGSPDKNSIIKMPEVTGRSLRHGLQILQGYNVRISISGSGIITSQKPKAGKNIPAGDMCSLQLNANR